MATDFYEQYNWSKIYGWTPSVVSLNGGVSTVDSYTSLGYVRHTLDQMGAYLQRPTGRPATIQELVDYLYQVADRYGISRDVAYRQIDLESKFNPSAVSSAGAVGIAQFTEATAAQYGLADRTDPYASLDAWGRYMKDLIRQWGGDYKKALASYNWGQGNVGEAIKSWGESWLGKAPAETRNYVAKILGADADEWFNPTTGQTVSAGTPGAMRRPSTGYGSTASASAGAPCGTFDFGCQLEQFFTSDTAKDVGKRIGLVVLAVVILALAIVSLR